MTAPGTYLTGGLFVSVKSDSFVDAAIERIAALPPGERRAAFFLELGKLDPFSRDRWELAEFGRRRFAHGPYLHHEWETLTGVVYPRRQLTPNEQGRQADHAAAIAVVEERRLAWLAARGEAQASSKRAKRLNTHREEDRAKYEEARVAAAELGDLERAAWQAFEDAQANEVRLRPFQSERTASAGRNWLRWLRAGAGGAK